MFPPPEILGYSINWFELITVLSVLITLVFGRFYFSVVHPDQSFIPIIIPLGSILIIGYIFTYLMAYLEGQVYGVVKGNPAYFVSFWAHKKFLGFIFFLFLIVAMNQILYRNKLLHRFGDFMAVVVCFFIILEANACLFDGHGCYGRFTNLPWGMLFLHGSAPTILPVHPTPLYISLSHLLLLFLLLYFKKNESYNNQLLIILLIGTSILNFLIECVKNIDGLFFSLNFNQIVYGLIAISSTFLLINSSSSNQSTLVHKT